MADEANAPKERTYRDHVDGFLNAAAPGMEEIVNSESFGKMVAQAAGNVVALHRIGNSVLDLTLRNLRLAGRSDVTSLHRQLARTEDKLEAVLETVERLEDQLEAERGRRAESEESSSQGSGKRPSRSTGRTGTARSRAADQSE